MNNNENEGLRWFLQGRRDGRTAKRNADNADYEVACFLFQQGAEKVLKAFLFLKGERAILSHSTLKIAEQCNSYDSHFKAIFEACEQLDIFYIPTRYPNGIPDGVPYEFFKKHHAVTGQHAYSRIFDLVSPYFSSLADSH